MQTCFVKREAVKVESRNGCNYHISKVIKKYTTRTSTYGATKIPCAILFFLNVEKCKTFNIYNNNDYQFSSPELVRTNGHGVFPITPLNSSSVIRFEF